MGIRGSWSGVVRVWSGRDLDRVRLELRSLSGYFGDALAVVGDVNGDSLPDLAAGAPRTWPGPPGGAVVVGLLPFLAPIRAAISRSAGGLHVLQLHLGPSRAFHRYQLLASASGTGPTFLAGLEVPLTADALFQQSLAGAPPPWVLGSSGVVDARGDGTAAITLAPGQLPPSLVGRSLTFAAVAAPLHGVPDFSTPPSFLRVLP